MPKSSDIFTPLIVANWKMQLDPAATVARIKSFRAALKNYRGRVQPVICPSFPALLGAQQALKGSRTRLGAQNLFWDVVGAYTGEVSPTQLRECGVEYVIIGHSERRQLLGETDEMVARKLIAAVTNGLQPILCVGENASERASGQHESAVRRQVEAALRSAPPPSLAQPLIIAYEPIWAIGTGQPANPAQAEQMRGLIERIVIDRFTHGQTTVAARILYGGSVEPENIRDYVYPGGYSGALVGGASLDPAKFAAMITTLTSSLN